MSAASGEAVAPPVLGSTELAAKVYDSAMTNFYAVLLDEAMKALSEVGYSVAAGWKGARTLMLPDAVREEVARRVHYRRQQFLAPVEDDEERRSRVERDVRDGYPQRMLDELMLGWAKAGVFVVSPTRVDPISLVGDEPVESTRICEDELAWPGSARESRSPVGIEWLHMPAEDELVETESARK